MTGQKYAIQQLDATGKVTLTLTGYDTKEAADKDALRFSLSDSYRYQVVPSVK